MLLDYAEHIDITTLRNPTPGTSLSSQVLEFENLQYAENSFLNASAANESLAALSSIWKKTWIVIDQSRLPPGCEIGRL